MQGICTTNNCRRFSLTPINGNMYGIRLKEGSMKEELLVLQIEVSLQHVSFDYRRADIPL